MSTPKTARQIISGVPNMSIRPEFTSGRGAKLSDLDSKRLEAIYTGIKENHGDKAAKAFVKMVEAIPAMSATAFLIELYALEARGWKFKKPVAASGIAIAKNEDGEYNMGHGMMSVLGAITNNRDETQAIKAPFLRNHGVKPKTQFEMDERGFVRRYW